MADDSFRARLGAALQGPLCRAHQNWEAQAAYLAPLIEQALDEALHREHDIDAWASFDGRESREAFLASLNDAG